MRKFFSIIIVLTAFFSCKEPFEPVVDATNQNLLVVEGYINTGGGATRIQLSRTSSLQNKPVLVPEANARVQIEAEGAAMAESISNSQGICIISANNLSPSVNYRLRITTNAGKIYLSDPIESKNTPPIDSISWKIKDLGIQIYANTHDPSNSTRYYGYTFDETWEVRSPYLSTIEYKNGKIVDRDPNLNIYRCWVNDFSKQILLGSTAKLAEDKLTLNPLTYISGTSPRISELYSINVYQYGLTKEGYEYLQNMKKNTEQLGSIFDPQPSEIKGNIHCVSDPGEQVVGFVSAGRITSKRIYISKFQIPGGYEWRYNLYCELKNIPPDSVEFYAKYGFLLIDLERGQFGETTYNISTPVCIDCRLRGSNVKPSFWPN